MSCSVCLCTHHFAYHPDDACEIKGCGCTQFRVLDQTAWAKKKTAPEKRNSVHECASTEDP